MSTSTLNPRTLFLASCRTFIGAPNGTLTGRPQEKPVHQPLLGVSLRFFGFTERARGVSDIHLQLASPGEILARSMFGEP